MSRVSIQNAWHKVWSLQGTLDPYTFTLVRVIAGANLVPHGAQKLFGWFGGGGLEIFARYLDQHGFQPSNVVSLYIGSLEFFGGIALVIGLGTRFVSILLVGLMGVAVIVIHWPRGFFWTDKGFEYPLMWTVLALVLVVHGAGALSVDQWLNDHRRKSQNRLA